MNNALGWIIFPGEQLGLDHWLDLIRELFYTGSTAGLAAIFSKRQTKIVMLIPDIQIGNVSSDFK